MTDQLTDNMVAVLQKIAEVAHGKYNEAAVQGLERRGLVTQPPYKGLILTERGYFQWLFMQGRINKEMLEDLLKGAGDD